MYETVELELFIESAKSNVGRLVHAVTHECPLGEKDDAVSRPIPQRGAVVEWLEQLGCGTESRRIA